MLDKNTNVVEDIYSHEKDTYFKSVMNFIFDHKIENLVHNANKVNTATSQIDQKGYENK